MPKHASAVPFELDQAHLALLHHIRQIMPCDSSGLYLYDSAARALIPHSYLGDGERVMTGVPLGQGVIGESGQNQTPIRIGDMRADPRCVFIDPASSSELAVPVLHENTLLGVLNIESHRPHAYTDQHVTMLQSLAAQAALLLHMARKYKTLADNNNDLLDTLYARRRETEALQRLAAIASSAVDLDEMLANALRETAQLLDCEGAQFLMPDYVTYRLEAHAPSLYGLARSWPVTSLALDGPGYLVEVFHTGAFYISHTPSTDARPDCRNALACPLNIRNRTLGVLHLINQQSGIFTEAQIEIAQAIAHQIAVSMGSAQMFAAERRRTEMLTQINQISQNLYTTLEPQALLRQTAQSIYEVLGHEAVYVYLLDEDGQMARVAANAIAAPNLEPPENLIFPVSSGVVGRAIRTGQTQIIPDVRDDPDYVAIEEPHRLQSCLAVPLQRGEQVIGAIEVLSTQLNAFGKLESDALETLAVQVGTALQNAQLYNQAQRRLLEQGVVYQIGQDLTAILDFQDLCNAMVQHMNRALDTSACMVGRYESAHHMLRIESDYRAPHHRAANRPLLTGAYLTVDDNTVIDQAIRTRQAMAIYADDLQAPAEARALLDELGDYALLIVPMVKAARVVGVVSWTDQRPGRKFSAENIQLARTLVAQATIALDNALLFSELETHARQLAEANQLRTQFLATISHELRTPMNSIIGFTEMLLEGIYGELSEHQLSRMGRIRDNAYRLLALIDDLLDLSNIDAGRMALHVELVGIGDAILTAAQTLEPEAAAKGLTLACNISDDLPRIEADPQRLHQIITNLLSNAIKFTHVGGVTIACHKIDQGGQTYIQTAVTDTGIGISEANRQIIFDEFRQVDGSSTRAYGGTGMGLSLTKKLVEMMGGTIWVESELNQGSTFTFLLPSAPRTVSA
jgi:signal transduction histidine kinase/putative methionine-R-sulfoxide reductase with GAF domain